MNTVPDPMPRRRVADVVDEHRTAVNAQDQQWRQQGQAEAGGSNAGWGLDGEVQR